MEQATIEQLKVSAPQYITWDYVRNLTIAYEREGECLRCGACCKGKIHLDGDGIRGPMRGRVYHSGVWYELPKDDVSRRWYRIKEIEHTGQSCGCLTDEGLCNSRDNGKYAPICQDWPVSPDHQLLFPTCGYTFKEVNRWPIALVNTQSTT